MTTNDRDLIAYLMGRVADIPQDTLDRRAGETAWEQEIRVSDEMDEAEVLPVMWEDDEDQDELDIFAGDDECPNAGDCCVCGTCDCDD